MYLQLFQEFLHQGYHRYVTGYVIGIYRSCMRRKRSISLMVELILTSSLIWGDSNGKQSAEDAAGANGRTFQWNFSFSFRGGGGGEDGRQWSYARFWRFPLTLPSRIWQNFEDHHPKKVQNDENLTKCIRLKTTGWWFRIIFIFTPTCGKWSNLTMWQNIFFKWVVQPPTVTTFAPNENSTQLQRSKPLSCNDSKNTWTLNHLKDREEWVITCTWP